MLWIPKWPSFYRAHPRTCTYKRKTYQVNDLGTFCDHKGRFHRAPSPKRHREIPERVISTQIFHPIGSHQGGSSHQGEFLGKHLEIHILDQDKSLESREDLVTPTDIQYQIPTNLEDVDKDMIGADLMREDMANLWSTKDLLGRGNMDIVVWNHRLNHCSLKSLLRLSKRGIMRRKISKFQKLYPCVACMFENSHNKTCRTKGKWSGRSISKPLDTRPRVMTSIDQMVSAQSGITPKPLGI